MKEGQRREGMQDGSEKVCMIEKSACMQGGEAAITSMQDGGEGGKCQGNFADLSERYERQQLGLTSVCLPPLAPLCASIRSSDCLPSL